MRTAGPRRVPRVLVMPATIAVPVPECDPCSEYCQGGEHPSVPSGGSGGQTADPASGVPRVNAGSPSWRAFNRFFDGGLAYNSQAAGADIGFGANWMAKGLAGLQLADSIVPSELQIGYTQRPGRAFVYDPSVPPDGNYQPGYFVRDRLGWNGSTSKYDMLETSGAGRVFGSDGKVVSSTDAGGNAMDFIYSGSEINEVRIVDGSDSAKTVYQWSGTPRRVTDAYVVINGRYVKRTTYGYSGTQLVTIKDYVNSTAGTGTPDWGSAPVETWRFSYHSGNGLLRHVITPENYRQMVNNGLNPDSASTSDLDDYAAAEYAYTGSLVSTFYTHGRRYSYGFTYTASSFTPGSSMNVWTLKTEVTQPDGSLETYYFNAGNQLMLKKVSVTSPSAKTWYPLAQIFDDTSARILTSATASAITSVNEGNADLFALASGAGRITEYAYDSNGLPDYVGLREGTGGTLNKLRSYTHVARTVGSDTIYKRASETVYRNDGSTGDITTSYSYVWHSGTFQPSQVTTTLPVVSSSENGRGATLTRVSNYDSRGYLTSETDERGTATTYQYDKARGGLTQVIRDQGGGRLNLTTDYVVDDLSRRVLSLGPAHDVDLAGTATNLRTAEWTYYLDQDGKTVSFRGYRTTGGSPVDQIVGPVTVNDSNAAPPSGYSGYRQSTTYNAVYGSSGIPSPTTTYAQTTWVRWKVGLSDKSAELKEEWTYFDIPSSGYGAQSTNYGKKLFAYDSNGRLNQTTCAGGTIDKTTFNAMGWAVQEELGTSAGLVVTRANQYDDNGNLTRMTLPVNTITSNDRVTDYRYDWRNRRTETETNDGTYTLIAKVAYDNRDLLLEETRYHTSISNSNRTAYQTFSYDVLGRQYRSEVYGVSTTTGATSNPQTSNRYYEPGNQVARDAPSGSALFTATTYDAIGRTLKVFQAYEASGFTPGSDPSSVTSAVVMEQQEFAWDAGSNLLGTITRLRFDTATGNGELQKPGTAPEARASYMASYPDALGRVISTADYGAAASASWTRPATVPTRSDTVLVNSTTYDGAGNATEFLDPDSVKTTRAYDDSDRLVTVVENATGSVPAKRTTHYEYTDDGWLKKLKCDNATTGQQVTEWVYGVLNGGGSDLNSNRLVGQKFYADSTGGSDCESYGYNRQQQMTSRGDQNGTLRILQYDKVGRLIYDVATIVGSGLDNTIVGRGSAFNERGLKNRAFSISPAPAAVVNDVVRLFNGFNQLVTEYQEHSGAVNTSTSLKVQYSYENGSANTIRPTGVTYPDGTVITTAYTSGQAGFLSRPDQIKEGSTVVASMRYLGLGVQIGLKYDGVTYYSPELSYQNGSTGDAGDKYTGLDRFGRLVETIWEDSGATKLVHSKYGRNRSGGVVWRRDDKAHSLSVISQDDYYWYDGLQQVTRHDRGDLTPGSGPPYTGIDPATRQQKEDFTYDETGNWPGYQSSSPALTQTRTHNKGNEITGITNPSSVVQPVYDGNGNMTTMSKPGDWTTGYTCKWDVWNRLVEVRQGSSTVIGSYAYDAETRRTKSTAGGSTRDFYYNIQWRAVEERISGSVKAQYVWHPQDRWTLIRRKYSSSGPLNETHFCLRDYLDPVAIISSAGTVEERYSYDAFGNLRIMDATFAPRGGGYAWSWFFHGEFCDPETLLYNYGYRYYHTSLGRWLSKDPMGEEASKNLYLFTHNNASNNLDWLGMIEPPDFIKPRPPILKPSNWECYCTFTTWCECCQDEGSPYVCGLARGEGRSQGGSESVVAVAYEDMVRSLARQCLKMNCPKNEAEFCMPHEIPAMDADANLASMDTGKYCKCHEI